MSGYFPDGPESLRIAWKDSGESGKFPDSLDIFRWSGKFPNSLENFRIFLESLQVVWKVSRKSSNILDGETIYKLGTLLSQKRLTHTYFVEKTTYTHFCVLEPSSSSEANYAIIGDLHQPEQHPCYWLITRILRCQPGHYIFSYVALFY